MGGEVWRCQDLCWGDQVWVVRVVWVWMERVPEVRWG